MKPLDEKALEALEKMRAEMLAEGVNGWPNTVQGVIERLRAALDPAPGWMPMDSAPKDGTSVLLFTHWAGDEIAPDPFDEVQIGYWDEGNLSGDIFHREQGWSTTRIGEPTHWQPLPAAPMSQEG